jgi:hypothetical protein
LAPLPEPRLPQDTLVPIAAVNEDIAWLAKTDFSDAAGIDDDASRDWLEMRDDDVASP